MKPDQIKIYVNKASGGEFLAQVYVSDLTPALRDALRLDPTLNRETQLEVIGEYEVYVDDPSDYIANAQFGELIIYSPGDAHKVTLEYGDETIDSDDIERQLDARIDWSDFFTDRAAAAADRAYDEWKDRQSE